MRLYGLLCMALIGCATASPPGEQTDASTDGPGKKDAGVDAKSSDAPASSTCTNAMTCPAAMMLGTVSGDTQNLKLSAMGYQAAWFRVRVTEDNQDFPGLTLRVSSKLTFPASVGFETYVYVNAGSDVASECAITTGTRSTVGNVQTVRAEWGEGIVPNASNDGRNVTIEVRPVGINCSMPEMWQLEVEGNWL